MSSDIVLHPRVMFLTASRYFKCPQESCSLSGQGSLFGAVGDHQASSGIPSGYQTLSEFVKSPQEVSLLVIAH